MNIAINLVQPQSICIHDGDDFLFSPVYGNNINRTIRIILKSFSIGKKFDRCSIIDRLDKELNYIPEIEAKHNKRYYDRNFFQAVFYWRLSEFDKCHIVTKKRIYSAWGNTLSIGKSKAWIQGNICCSYKYCKKNNIEITDRIFVPHYTRGEEAAIGLILYENRDLKLNSLSIGMPLEDYDRALGVLESSDIKGYQLNLINSNAILNRLEDDGSVDILRGVKSITEIQLGNHNTIYKPKFYIDKKIKHDAIFLVKKEDFQKYFIDPMHTIYPSIPYNPRQEWKDIINSITDKPFVYCVDKENILHGVLSECEREFGIGFLVGTNIFGKKFSPRTFKRYISGLKRNKIKRRSVVMDTTIIDINL